MLHKISALFLAWSFIFATAPTTPEKKVKPPNIDTSPKVLSGVYTITGKQFNKTYRGLAVIAETPSAFMVNYQVGIATYAGCGTIEGDKFIVGWSTGNRVGVTVYKIVGGKLQGRWTALPKDTGTEDLEFKEGFPEEEGESP